MGDGTKDSPYTREDVLSLMETEVGVDGSLDLSEKHFEIGIDLSNIDLTGLIFNGVKFNKVNFSNSTLHNCQFRDVSLIGANLESALLSESHLEGANLSGANMKNVELDGAHLEEARLARAHLEGAEFFNAHLEDADLMSTSLDRSRLSGAYLQGALMHGAKFTYNTEMHSVNWGDYILGEERTWYKSKEIHYLRWAEDTYRRLKMWYTNAGISDTAAKFYYREKEVSRKAATRPLDKISGWLSWAVFGHGERWRRILIWIACLILLFGFIYYLFGSAWSVGDFWSSLYFSAVSFTALGYGGWVNVDNDWIWGIGAFESLVGVSLLALLLVTFFRKWTR